MRILWITNIIFPYPGEKLGITGNVFGGWLIGLANMLKKEKNITLAVASTYNGKEILKFYDNYITYYLLPCKNNLKYNKKLEKIWQEINDDFKPNITHIHGTEYPHGLAYQKACPKIKTITSVQGLISICANNYIAGLKHIDIIKNITIRDLFKKTIYQEQKDFEKRGCFEKDILKNSTLIIGRTEWDYANVKGIVPKANYFKCNETLRDSFYKKEWMLENVEKHSIFISQANYPLKGFHVLLESISILKNKYPDVKVYVAGNNILDFSTFKNKLKKIGYAKYLNKLINKYNLREQVVFTGLLEERKLLEKLTNSHVFVQASSIENSSNSLGEAMLIGMPCVASNVGGTSSIITDKTEGFLYPYGDYGLLAHYIDKIFSDDDLARKIGKNAQKHANKTHDKQINKTKIINIYDELYKY